jgi:hypothetical protein
MSFLPAPQTSTRQSTVVLTTPEAATAVSTLTGSGALDGKQHRLVFVETESELCTPLHAAYDLSEGS